MRCSGLGALALPLFLGACCRPTVAPPPERIRVPAALTAPCVLDDSPTSIGALYEAYETARQVVEECNGRLTQIRELK